MGREDNMTSDERPLTTHDCEGGDTAWESPEIMTWMKTMSGDKKWLGKRERVLRDAIQSVECQSREAALALRCVLTRHVRSL